MAELGSLYLVSIPIGNPLDLSPRATGVLSEVDKVICENRRMGSSFLKKLGIKATVYELNKHNELAKTPTLLKALGSGQSLALISDAGTPVFADPGLDLVQEAIRLNVPVVPVPGASSLMAALVSSGFSLNQFHFAGFIPRQSKKRLNRLKELQKICTLLVIFETPYRLNPLLRDTIKIFPSSTPAALCMNLTFANEKIFRCNLKKMQSHFEKAPFRGEFVLLLDNSTLSRKKLNN